MYETKTVKETVQLLKTDPQRGLTEKEALNRLSTNGRNVLREKKSKSPAESFIEQLNDPLIYVLLAAAVVSMVLKEFSDAAIIGVVVVLNAIVGVIQEGKAQRALQSLKQLTSPHALVIRDGEEKEIPADELVCGDIVCLETGVKVPADVRLIQTENLKVEEAALTGEDMPVTKEADFSAKEGDKLSLGDRRNMAFMTTLVNYGRGRGVVTSTGMDTEIGRIAAMIADSKEETTPLQKKLGELGTVLSILSLLLCAGLFLIAVLQKRDVFEMLLTAISLAVAAVPEGLPAVVTICLALSVTRMVKVHTIIRRLPSVETLGAVSVVCSDKTGTLTQNKMTVEECFAGDMLIAGEDYQAWIAGERAGKHSKDGTRSTAGDNTGECERKIACDDIREMITAFVLCNDASIGEQRVGDPTELALLDLGALTGLYKKDLEFRMPRTGELPFDSDRKMMTTLHDKKNAAPVSFTKGAPDEVLKKCTKIRVGDSIFPLSERKRQEILEVQREMSARALRTLAAAEFPGTQNCREDHLIFLGMVGMRDPVRPEALQAVQTFRRAKVRTVMITGDHVDTAYTIARQLDIAWNRAQCMTGAQIEATPEEDFPSKIKNTTVFARVSPAQKVQIVKAFQKNGEIVAMTGDGVNDAPSLKAADIGIAMGQNGTDVAKEASDMVLTDDNFATIEKAIEEGRGVYENIRKTVIFLLSSNLGEILTMFLTVVFGLASPLKSAHILWINLITDSLPALALGVDENNGDELMKNAPRKKKESLFARGGLSCTLFYGLLIAAISLFAYLLIPAAWIRIQGYPVNMETLKICLHNSGLYSKAQTYAFTVLSMSQLFHAVGMRDTSVSIFCMDHKKNKLMAAACCIGFFLQLSVTKIPFLINAFGTAGLTMQEWGILGGLSAFPLLAHELIILFDRVGNIFLKRKSHGKDPEKMLQEAGS